ncbi:ATP-binding protein [Halobium salinum]
METDWLTVMRERRDEAYTDSKEHLLDELQRIDFLLWARVAQWREETVDASNEFAGYYISDEKVDELLSPRTDGQELVLPGGTTGKELAEYAEELARVIRNRVALTREVGRKLRLASLSERFELDRRSRDVFLFAAAPELDPKYETVYAYLNDDITRGRPTVDLILRALSYSPRRRLEDRSLLGSNASLRQNQLVRLGRNDEMPLSARSLRVDDRVVNYLLGIDTLDESLEGFVDHVEPTEGSDYGTNGESTDEPDSNGESDDSPDENHFESATQSKPQDAHEQETPYEGGDAEEETRRLGELVLDDDVRVQLEQLVRKGEDDFVFGMEPPESSTTVMAHFYGPYGSGKRDATVAICADRDVDLLVADVRGLVTNGIREPVEVLLREARLQDAALAISHLDVLDDESNEDVDLTVLIRALDRFEGWVFLLGKDALRTSQRLGANEHQFVAVNFPIPSYDRRRELWDAVDGLPDGIDTADLAGKFRLTGGQIEDAVATARSRAYGTELTVEDVYAGCRLQSREKLGSLGRVVEPVYRWDDIVLPGDKKKHLEEVAAHVEHQGRVYTDWGFKEKFSLGNGVIVLFTGQSGTGKTMAAEIIANEVGLDLYKIDLSSVVSKYIGETEKNLSQVFDEAENSNAILFFDEADALFGKRSEVSDAHDRYANIEVNYLLQRVEEHDGAVILTTNFKQNIDEAFLRRIHLSVDFPRPDEAARKRIWEGIFPVGTPPKSDGTNGEEASAGETIANAMPVGGTPVGDLDYEFLSTFELTGGNIKNIALAAAFLAASGWQRGPDEGLHWAEREDVRAELQDECAKFVGRVSKEGANALGDMPTACREIVVESLDEDEQEEFPAELSSGETYSFLNTVEMVHVLWALRRELQKNGKLVKPEAFGEYRELVS